MTPIQTAELELRNQFPMMTDADYAAEVLASLDLDSVQPFTLGHVQRAALDLRDRYAGQDWARNFVWMDWERVVYEVTDFYLAAL